MTDLGDIALPAPTRLMVGLRQGDCELVAVGPLGSLGLSRVHSIFDARGHAHRFQLPETGSWWLEAVCHGRQGRSCPRLCRSTRPR